MQQHISEQIYYAVRKWDTDRKTDMYDQGNYL